MRAPGVIVDIDGTIARRKRDGRGPYDWARVGEDEVIEPIRELVEILHENWFDILYVSGRSEECYSDTASWLARNGFPYDDRLFMRPAGDYRPDEVVKAEIYQEHIMPYYEVRYVLDDRNKVVKMWRDLGLTCLQVAEGDF